jgi:hypothetical protein
MQFKPLRTLINNYLLKLSSIVLGTCVITSVVYCQQIDTINSRERAVERYGSVSVKPRLFNSLPKYLQIGDYIIVVDSYTNKGIRNSRTKIIEHLSGRGRISLCCPSGIIVNPGQWSDAILKPVRYKVVDRPTIHINEISKRDLARLDITAEPNSYVELMMPFYGDMAIELSKYLEGIKDIKKTRGIPVEFNDLTIQIECLIGINGTILSGSARYPIKTDVQQRPISISIHPDFLLGIDSMTFTVKEDPILNGKLFLPATITQIGACERAYLDLMGVHLRPHCEVYEEFPISKFGLFGIGNTTMAIEGRGFVVDFSSTESYSASGEPPGWEGVILLEGETQGATTGTAISNIGYLQAPYAFVNGIVESAGLFATFNLTEAYQYMTAQPFGYILDVASAQVGMSSSQVSGGTISNGSITLPRTAARQADDSSIKLNDLSLTINASMSLIGTARSNPGTTLYWGDFINAGGGNRKSFGAADLLPEVKIFFAAVARPDFVPISADDAFLDLSVESLSGSTLDSYNIQGATFGHFSILVANSPDIPDPYNNWDPDKPKLDPKDNEVWFSLDRKRISCWINVASQGVNCSIESMMADDSPDLELGNIHKPGYVGIKPFQINGTSKDSVFSTILLQSVESAVMNCDYSSSLWLPEPTKSEIAFSNMVFTSTANNAGGDLIVDSNDSLSYWGLDLVSKPNFNSSGLISVKEGQIIVTAAGLAERRHFSEPFWLTWGEILADGSVGRLFFDYNSAGQQFDNFDYIHDAVRLSQYDPAREGFLRVGGNIFFPFFGADYLHIKDTYDQSIPVFPYSSRVIELSDETLTGFAPSDLSLYGNWLDGLGIFYFDIKYSEDTQDGFLGTGSSSLRYLSGGALASTLDMNSRGTSIRIGSDLLDQRSITLGPVANISNITRIWGCVSIKDNSIENIVIGGEVTNAANLSVVIRSGAYLAASLQITPSSARLTLDGEAYLSFMAASDLLINGHMQLTSDHSVGYIEGEVLGNIRTTAGLALIGSSIEAEGQLNWHLGSDFVDLQGLVWLEIMGFGGGYGLGAGLYVGINAPKSRAWILDGTDPRYGLNKGALPTKLTGVYGYIKVHQGINLYVISGGYDVFVGLGIFFSPAPEVIANLGGRVYGEILGGLASAAAKFNLQFYLGYPIGFQGTIGLEACALWVVCVSVDLTAGLNSNEGFYLR